MNSPVIDLNVVALPDDEAADRAVALSERLAAEFQSQFTLNHSDCLSHISLYQARYPDELGTRLETVSNIVSRIAAATVPIPIMFGRFSVLAGFIFWEVAKCERLVRLHRTLVRALSPLRDGQLVPQHIQLLEDAIPRVFRESILTWGNPMSMEAFQPHVTLTRINGPSAKTASGALGSFEQRSEIRDLAITTIGPNGICPRILAEFPIGHSGALEGK